VNENMVCTLNLDDIRRRLQKNKQLLLERLEDEGEEAGSERKGAVYSPNRLHPPKPPDTTKRDALLQARSESQLNEVEKALERLEEGTFGFCVKCGNKISEERIDAMPSIKYCLECQHKLD
jgi:RNA polymerase-binding transcription factor DksA